MQKKKKEVGLLPDAYQVNLSDFALFLSVMKVKAAYEDVLGIILDAWAQDDIFGRDLAMYTFKERCEEVPDLWLEDGTSKIFLNMTSKNGRPELVSLLQYMKYTTLDNEDVTEKDERIVHLDQIVNEVRQSEEWEDAGMNIYEMGMERGKELGIEQGSLRALIRHVDSAMKNLHLSLQEACAGLEISVEEYEEAKRQLVP